MGALRRGVLLLAAALLLSGTGFAQSSGAEFHGGDPEFMNKAALEGMAQFQLAYAALQNAQSEQVKAFARQVLSDYYKSQGELINIATEQFVALPTEPDPKDKAALESLLQLHGEDFDKAYMQTMLKSHRTDLTQLKQEAKAGNNRALIDWANQNLAPLQSQFKEAEKVASTVGVETTEKTTGNNGETKSNTEQNKAKPKSDTADQKPY